MLSPHATKVDLVGTDELPGYLSSVHAARVSAWDDAEVDRWLERCSDVVDDLSGRAVYETDEFGNATDLNIAAGLRMATCAMVEFWLTVGEANDIDGLAFDQISVTGFSGHRSPEATNRVLRPLRRAGLLRQPSESSRSLGLPHATEWWWL